MKNYYGKLIRSIDLLLRNWKCKIYKQKILGETKFKVSIEAASTDCWRKYVGTEGLTFGIDEFGKSAPYKDIYKYFGLTAKNISKKTKNLIKN